MDAVREIMIEDPELTSELRIKTEGAAALVALAAGDHQGAVAAADTALRVTAVQRPTYYAAIWGYVGPAEAYVAQWEIEVAANGVTATTRRGADVALKRLKSFAGVFPIGRPRLHVLMGRRHWLLGHRNDAFASWRRAVDLAQQLSMPFELALAELELGRHGNAADDRDVHLQRALELFVALGAAPRADLVRSLIATP